jgi:3-methyl-2-oxobutanoate hydroxymethyltransferase
MRDPTRFAEMKRAGRPIAVLTAYDAPTARILHESGVDILLVGDSVGTNMLGYASEREVTLADMCHHVGAARRGAPEAAIIGDLPFASYDTPEAALTSARRLVAAGADIVKLEGFRPAIVAFLVAAGIAVCGHLGLEPQHHARKVSRGREAREAAEIVAHAIGLDRAGASLLVLEMIPDEVAAEVTRAIGIPTIGIGSGGATDGQVLVICDVIGTTARDFRHNRRYQEVGRLTREAAQAYVHDVRARAFPAETNMSHMAPDELVAFRALLEHAPAESALGDLREARAR